MLEIEAAMSCPICGSSKRRLVALATTENLGLTGRHYRYSKCLRCGVINQEPQPDSGFLSGYYEAIEARQSAFYASQEGIAFKNKILSRQSLHMPALSAFLKDLISGFEQQFPYWHHLLPGLIVDLGAGSGGFCAAAVRRGFVVEGVEQCVHSVRLAQEQGIGLRQADLRSDVARDLVRGADNVVMNHVFEHISDPCGFLRDLRVAMKMESRLLLMIPNPNSLWRYVFGDKWYGWDPPVHLHHWDECSLRSQLENAGFRVIKLHSVGRVDSLAASLERARIRVGRFRLFLRVLMIPLMPLLVLVGLGPELLCVAAPLPSLGTDCP